MSSPADTRRTHATRLAGSAVVVATLMVAGCGAAEPPTRPGTGPIKAAATCPLGAADLVPGQSTPRERLQAFEACVGRHAKSGEHVQAAGWIRDWYTAASCIHKCDSKGNAAMAHESMWKGLRYIASATLPAGDAVDADCREARRALVVSIDEAMNNLVGWRGFSTTQCKSEASMEAMLRKIAEATEFRNRLTGQIADFKNKRQ